MKKTVFIVSILFSVLIFPWQNADMGNKMMSIIFFKTVIVGFAFSKNNDLPIKIKVDIE